MVITEKDNKIDKSKFDFVIEENPLLKIENKNVSLKNDVLSSFKNLVYKKVIDKDR